MTQTQDAIEILDDLFGGTPGYREAVAEETEKLQVATLIYNARAAAGLSQKQLADKINTRQSVISRLEDADYTGHSLTMLRRIAIALGYKLEVSLAKRSEAVSYTAPLQTTAMIFNNKQAGKPLPLPEL